MSKRDLSIPTNKSPNETESISKMEVKVVIAIFVLLVIDGIDLQMLALTLPLLMEEFNLSMLMAGTLATWTLAGMALGGILAGWLADQIGRVKVIVMSVIIFSITTTLIGFTQSYYQFAGLRFICGFGLSSLCVIGPMMAAEYIPTSNRTTILGILQAGWSVGYVVAALLSSYFLPNYGWRIMFIMAIFPGMIGLWLMRGLADPPSWLVAAKAKAKAKQPNEWISIWVSQDIRKTFILWSLAGIALQFGFYGANTWLPSYLAKVLNINFKNAGFYMAATYATMILGKALSGYLADKFGRRKMWIIVGIAAAVTLPFVMHFSTPGNVVYLLPLSGLLYGAPFAINSTYMNESFPTFVRGTAVSTAYNVGRVGSLLSPLFIGAVATQYSIMLGIALLGVAYAIAAIIPGLFIREKMYDPKALIE
ncbi:MAG: putative niacin/nicotinamide transporter NaiP [Pelotomaculum sp. PtaB.Bin104]|nr:MAG: putative niacin/nicotinamide transporter NaiP [Pelotomaculum sp. PtaB.Bin104]